MIVTSYAWGLFGYYAEVSERMKALEIVNETGTGNHVRRGRRRKQAAT